MRLKHTELYDSGKKERKKRVLGCREYYPSDQKKHINYDHTKSVGFQQKEKKKKTFFSCNIECPSDRKRTKN